MPPRVKTFGWRLLSNALPTAQRMHHRIKTVSPNCQTCGQWEDDLHLFFLCNFSSLCWFVSDFNLKADNLSSLGSVQDIIAYLSANGINIYNLLIMLWQIWKARNDINFKTKIWEPQQVCNAAQAMAKTYESVHQMEEDSCQDFNRAEENNIRNSVVKIPAGTRVYVDASWKEEKTGVGIFIHNPSNHNAIVIKAQSLNAGTPLLAEAEGLFLAMQIARHLQLQDPIFLSDNSEIVNAVQNEDYIQNPGHWSLRPILSRIKNFLQDQQVRIIWISRELNKVADGLAKSARQAQTNSCLAFDCSNISHISSRDVCPTKRALSFTPNGAVNVTHALCF